VFFVHGNRNYTFTVVLAIFSAATDGNPSGSPRFYE